jgi:hypothetical protein
MRSLPTDYGKYIAWRDLNASKLSLPVDWKELSSVATPASTLVWQYQWYIQSGADKYIRIWERYGRWPGLLGMSRRMNFVYHYGQLMGLGADNVPVQKPKNPVDIRIDDIGRPIHLHFGAPDPHHDQSVVKGLQLNDLDMFEFLDGIIRHRKTGKSLDKIFGFTIG